MGVKEVYDLAQVSPEEWGASEDYDAWEDRDTNQVFVHWGGTPVPEAAISGVVEAEMDVLRGWERYHLRKGWRGLAYDWAIGNSGKLYRVRGDAQSGATGGDIDLDGIPNNVEAEAIVLIIGSGQSPSYYALRTLKAVLDTLDRREETWGHTESAKYGKGTVTSCPGSELIVFVRNYRAGSEVVPRPQPPERPNPVPPSTSWQQEVITKMDTIDLRSVSNSSSTFVRGDKVKTLQGLLVARGYAPANTIQDDGTLDGIGGPGTKEALGAFQVATRTGRSNGQPDYIVGKNTWGALLQVG